MNGFYVPGSVSSSYVANKRNEEGSLVYEDLQSKVGLQKQAALQQLDKAYSQTIENAYSAYLSSNKAVAGSSMGQGYKDLYKQIQEQQLMSNVLTTTQEVANQRASLEQQEAQAQAQIQEAFQTEVGYFDRLQQSFAEYFDYAKTLTDTDGNGYFDEYELNQSVDSMYDILSRAQPVGSYDDKGNYVGYTDTEGRTGMTYSEWIASQMGTSEEDKAWYQWFLGGGLNEFLSAPKSTKQIQEGELRDQAELQSELDAYVSGKGKYTTRLENYLSGASAEDREAIESERNLNIKLDADFDKAINEFTKRKASAGGNIDPDKKLIKQMNNYFSDTFGIEGIEGSGISKHITGEYELSFKVDELTKEQKEYLKSLGFKIYAHKRYGSFEYWDVSSGFMSKNKLRDFYKKLYKLEKDV